MHENALTGLGLLVNGPNLACIMIRWILQCNFYHLPKWIMSPPELLGHLSLVHIRPHVAWLQMCWECSVLPHTSFQRLWCQHVSLIHTYHSIFSLWLDTQLRLSFATAILWTSVLNSIQFWIWSMSWLGIYLSQILY